MTCHDAIWCFIGGQSHQQLLAMLPLMMIVRANQNECKNARIQIHHHIVPGTRHRRRPSSLPSAGRADEGREIPAKAHSLGGQCDMTLTCKHSAAAFVLLDWTLLAGRPAEWLVGGTRRIWLLADS